MSRIQAPPRDSERLNASVLNSFPKIDEAAVDALLAREIAANDKKIVVLDDDPTGVQTVHDVSVYTGWDHDSMLAGFKETNNLFYILTNSRGFTAEQTTKAHHEIAAAVDAAAKEAGREYIFISRSGSFMRIDSNYFRLTRRQAKRLQRLIGG